MKDYETMPRKLAEMASRVFLEQREYERALASKRREQELFHAQVQTNGAWAKAIILAALEAVAPALPALSSKLVSDDEDLDPTWHSAPPNGVMILRRPPGHWSYAVVEGSLVKIFRDADQRKTIAKVASVDSLLAGGHFVEVLDNLEDLLERQLDGKKSERIEQIQCEADRLRSLRESFSREKG